MRTVKMKVLISVLMVMTVMDSGIAQDNDSYLSALHNSHDVDTLQGSYQCLFGVFLSDVTSDFRELMAHLVLQSILWIRIPKKRIVENFLPVAHIN